MAERKKLVTTIKERCRVCFTCVRECPAKAIKIRNGQAEVLNDRCIACGNCVLVCSQNAKIFIDTKDQVYEILEDENVKRIGILAPSFPAEFPEIEDYQLLIGMIRRLGFDEVNEVAFGADLVARKYKDMLEDTGSPGKISSDCPAIVSYIEMYHPKLIDSLAPIVSPMVAMARVLREKYKNEPIKVVFIGPCIAKKDESEEIDAAITFRELRQMFAKYNIRPDVTKKSDFNAPKAGRGAIFPITRGLIQTVNIPENLYEGNLVVAEGRTSFQNALEEFENGLINTPHLELLCCEGCIMGPGTTSDVKRYGRRVLVSNYVKSKFNSEDSVQWNIELKRYESIDLSTSFSANDKRNLRPSQQEIEKVLHSMGKIDESDHLNCGACGYNTCVKHAIAIVEGLAEIEMCLPHTIEQLHDTIQDLNLSNEKLASVQQALKQSEKMAHMGQLSAGIAHELNNPLGIILMYSNILLDECASDEMKEDLDLITEQAERCKNIVGGLLNFARKNQVVKKEVDIVKLVQQSLNSVIIPEHVRFSLSSELKDTLVYLDTEQMIQLLTNLIKNANEAMTNGGELKIRLFETPDDEISISIKDTGTGIPKEDIEKIFEPFYTTKGIGKGTGLGLATAYGIVKMHKGKISVESTNNPEEGPTGTEFKIVIPRNSK